MEKRKSWQLAVIIAVMALTLYNILPTVFYYSKPLSSPVDETRANQVLNEMLVRVDALKDDGKEWIQSFNQLLGIEAKSIDWEPNSPGQYKVTFNSEHDARRFHRYLPRADHFK
jgi:SecD/SecF fusion protein